MLNWDDYQETTTESVLTQASALPPSQHAINQTDDEDEGGSGNGDTGNTGLQTIEMGAARVQVDDKAIINCKADLNQLVPLNMNGLGKNI